MNIQSHGKQLRWTFLQSACQLHVPSKPITSAALCCVIKLLSNHLLDMAHLTRRMEYLDKEALTDTELDSQNILESIMEFNIHSFPHWHIWNTSTLHGFMNFCSLSSSWRQSLHKWQKDNAEDLNYRFWFTFLHLPSEGRSLQRISFLLAISKVVTPKILLSLMSTQARETPLKITVPNLNTFINHNDGKALHKSLEAES